MSTFSGQLATLLLFPFKDRQKEEDWRKQNFKELQRQKIDGEFLIAGVAHEAIYYILTSSVLHIKTNN